MKGGFGRVFTMKVLVVTGNGKGTIGYAVGWSPLFETNSAILKAMKFATRRLQHVELLEGRTIYNVSCSGWMAIRVSIGVMYL